MSQMDALRVLKLYPKGLPSFYIAEICNMSKINTCLKGLKNKGIVDYEGWPHPIWKITEEGFNSEIYLNLREDPRMLKRAIEVLGYGPNEQLKIIKHLTDNSNVKVLKK